MGKKSLFLITYIAMILAVLVCFELVLRLFHYGYDTRPFVKPAFYQSVYVDNYDFLNKYTTETRSYSSLRRKNMFDSNKSHGRGFLIGESTPQGYPFESNNAFGKIAENALNWSENRQAFEIVNLSYTAMSSYYVSDAARKALAYDPDFIIIYAGHNEYFGTVSSSTGGGRFLKKMFLGLKEFKIFQLIFSILPVQADKGRRTLMETLSKSRHFLKNDAADGRVANDFIENIDEVVRIYKDKNIPVIIMEPVCNLYDLPPFAGEKDDIYSNFIAEYYKTYLTKDKKLMASIYNERIKHGEYDCNANISYLDSLYRSVLWTNSVIPGLITAKDLDTVPFRARSTLINSLRDYIIKNSKIYPNLYYIPLFDELTNRYGERAFGNAIFAEHVHFNMKGQLAVAQILADKIAQIFQLGPAMISRMSNIFTNEAGLLRSMYFSPVNEILALHRVNALTADYPYRGMLIPYKFDMSALSNNSIIKEDPALARLIASLPAGAGDSGPLNFEETILKYFSSGNDALKKMHDYMMACLTLYPGSYWPYLYLARLYRKTGSDKQLTVYFYETSYFLSDKNPEIYGEFALSYPWEADSVKNGIKQ